ncbi:MAG: DUF460 domain-containing protein, partial [Candidatus Altiarchaeales archaeon]|nr:DUF460 domain-containing protein [Candidatus Altiarchaeales archaeon]
DAPSFAQKVAASFGVPLYCPDRDLDVSLKNSLTEDVDWVDKHQRDACAAAYAAYNHNQNKLKNLSARGLDDEMKHLILQGISLSEAKQLLESGKKTVKTGDTLPCEKNSKPKPNPLSDDLRRLKASNKSLRGELESRKKQALKLKKQNRFLKSEMNETLRRDKAVASREKTIESLKRKLRRRRRELNQALALKNLLLDFSEGKIFLVPPYPRVCQGITRISNKIPSDFDYRGIDFVFAGRKKILDQLAEYGVPTARENLLEDAYGVKYIYSEKFRELRKGKERVSLENLVSEYRSRDSNT